MNLTSTARRHLRGLAICAGLTGAATFFAACGAGSPAYTPNHPPQPNGGAQHIHDALLNAAFLAPVGFNSPKMEEGQRNDFDNKDAVALRVHVAFASPTAAGISFVIFNSPAEAKAYADDFTKNIPLVRGTRIASTDAPDAVCADSTEAGGFCGLLVGQTFINAGAATVALGAGPLIAAARTTLATANP